MEDIFHRKFKNYWKISADITLTDVYRKLKPRRKSRVARDGFVTVGSLQGLFKIRQNIKQRIAFLDLIIALDVNFGNELANVRTNR